MKMRLAFFLLVAVVSLSAQTIHTFPALDTNNSFTGVNNFTTLIPGHGTYATMITLASPQPEQIWILTDAASPGNCGAGGGSYVVQCVYFNGAWTTLSSAGGGNPGGNFNSVQTNNSGVFGGYSWLTVDPGNQVLIGSAGRFTNYFDFGAISTPTNPASGFCRQYLNTSTGQMAWLSSSGGNCNPSGGVNGSGSSVVNHFAMWANTGGTLLADVGGATQDSSGNISTPGKIAAGVSGATSELDGFFGSDPHSTCGASAAWCFYGYNNTVYLAFNGGSPINLGTLPGSGTVTNVSGTLHQVDVSNNTTTPGVSLDPALILPGSLTMGASAVDFSSATSFKPPGTGGTLTLGSANQNWGTLGTGIVKNTTSTGAQSIAAGADIVSLWASGSCSGFLKSDLTCSSGIMGSPFNLITGGTNTTAAMIVGSGASFKVNFNAAALPAAQSGTLFQEGNADSTVSRIENDAFGAAAHFSSVRWDGTNASPTTLQSGDEITSLNAFGYDGSGVLGPQASFREYAAQAWTASHAGTYADVATTANNSTTLAEVIRFENDGGITVPATVTGGDKGAGTLNAGGLYIAGVPVVDTTDTQTETNKTVDGVTPTTMGYLDATSSIQTQLNAKAPLASPTFTGTTTIPALTLSGITGSTQCLHVSTLGVVSGTGSDCGSGAGGDTITSPNSTMTIGGTSTNTTIDLALGHANTWTGQQTFVAPILGTPASGNASNLTNFPTLNQNTTGSAGSVPWSGITAATGNLQLAQGTNTSEFDTTGATASFFNWKNTAASTSGATAKNSPFLQLTGTYWTGSASADDYWTFQNQPSSATLAGSSLLNIGHTGYAYTAVNFPNSMNTLSMYGQLSIAASPAGGPLAQQAFIAMLGSAAVATAAGNGIFYYSSSTNQTVLSNNNSIAYPIVTGFSTTTTDSDCAKYKGTTGWQIQDAGNPCVTSAAALTSTAFMTGAGSQNSQTPSATSTLDSSGNAIFAGSFSEGAAKFTINGSGLVTKDDNLTTAGKGHPIEINNATQTGVALTAGTGQIGSTITVTVGSTGWYRVVPELVLTTAGSGGTCTTGGVQFQISYTNGLSSSAYSNVVMPMWNVGSAITTGIVSTMSINALAVNSSADWIPARDNDIYSSANITIIAQQTVASNCTTLPIVAIAVYAEAL